jgi:hypothetical protein
MASSAVSFTPSRTDVERYRHLRRLAAELNQKIVETVPRQAMHEIGRAIGILQRGRLVFETEDQTSVLMDCCLYDWIEGGKNLVERYADNHPALAGPDERELLEAFRFAKYRILFPLSRLEGAGVYFMDLFSSEELFVMDIGMSQNSLNIAYATRTIPLGSFWMTGGAGLPTASEGIRKAGARLHERGLLRDGNFTDPHWAALTIVRTLLEEGASEHVKYQDVPSHGSGQNWRPHSQRQNTLASTPSRNSACICGSGKRYKRCCGRR